MSYSTPIVTIAPPTATVPAGVPIANDTLPVIGAVQLLKVLDGRPGGTEGIPGDATGGMWVNLKVAVPLNIATGQSVAITGAPAAGGALPVSFAGGFSVDTELPTGVLLADNLSNPTTPLVGAASMVWDPANGWLRVRGDTGFGIDVDVTRSVLPAGAATAAKQPAFGTAGAASTEVLSVQGRSGMVPVDVNILSGGSGGGTMDLATIKTVAVSTSTGATDAGTQRVVLAATQPTLTVQGSGNTTTPATGILTVQGDVGGVGAPIRVMAINQDNGAFTNGSGLVYPMAMERNDTLTTDPNPNSLGVPRISATRQQIMVIEDGNGSRTQRAGVSNSALAINLARVNDGLVMTGNGGAAGAQRVAIASDNTAFAVNATLAAETIKVIGAVNQGTSPWVVAGPSAHNAAITGNPLNLAAQVAPTAAPLENAAATQALLTQLIADPVGKLITLPYCAPSAMVSGATAAMTGVANTPLLAAPAAGFRNYITQITVTNSHATVGTDVLINDGTTALYVIPAAAVYGGATITFPVPLRQPTTATAINAQNVVTGASTRVSATGYVGR